MAVNDEESSEAESLVLLQNPVGSADGHVLVGQQGDLHISQPAVFTILNSGNIRMKTGNISCSDPFLIRDSYIMS